MHLNKLKQQMNYIWQYKVLNVLLNAIYILFDFFKWLECVCKAKGSDVSLTSHNGFFNCNFGIYVPWMSEEYNVVAETYSHTYI
jgi:hypothetical protein